MTDQAILLCENCQEYRHKSRFHAGRRWCDAPACQEKEGLILLDIARRVTDQRRVELATHLDALLEEPKPAHIKGIGWRIVIMRMQGMSPEDIAKDLDMKVGRVRHEEEVAMHQLAEIARERMGVQA